MALLLLKPVMLKARSKGRIVTREAAMIAVPGSTTDQVSESVAPTVAYESASEIYGYEISRLGKRGLAKNVL